MLFSVISVRQSEDYWLDLEFENGERRRFDMKPLLKLGPWDRIAAREQFKMVRVEHGTISWPGGIDVAPETLYDDSTPI
jgi:hypothetical protein